MMNPRQGWFRRLLFWGGVGLLTLVFLGLLAVLNNNFSLASMSREQFQSELNRSVEASTNWIAHHPEIMGNEALMFMIADMESMSGDPRLRELLDKYPHSRWVDQPFQPLTFVWKRMVDPHANVPRMDLTQAPEGGVAEMLWDAYAMAPDAVIISSGQRANMFSPTKFYWGARQHQLLALVMYRHFNGGSEELNNTINHLAEKIARDQHFDFRVTDSYVQRNAFVVGAARPDLIRSRWIERTIDYQHADGGWNYCWYGWCRGIFEFKVESETSQHATVQAAWSLYMLKYRYPQWVEQHYH